MPSRNRTAHSWLRSPAAALLTAIAAYAFFEVLFYCRKPEARPVGHRSGRITLLPLKPKDGALQEWLNIHDPAAILRGGSIPPVPEHALPPNAPRPEPEILPEAPRGVEPEPVVFTPAEPPGNILPELRRRAQLPDYPALPPEIYPKLTMNRKPFPGRLPPALLRRAASVNAQTAEFRISEGLLPAEKRISVISSSGDTEVDREIAGCINGWKFPELPAELRIVWEAAGEAEK